MARSEFDQFGSQIQELYCEQNKSSKYVVQFLRQAGFRQSVSDRQLKLYFGSKGVKKNINREIYQAMSILIDCTGQPLHFRITRANGPATKTPHDIKKQLKRGSKSKIPPLPDKATAMMTLIEDQAEWSVPTLGDDQWHPMESLLLPSDDSDLPRLEEDHTYGDDSDSESTASSDSMSGPASERPATRELVGLMADRLAERPMFSTVAGRRASDPSSHDRSATYPNAFVYDVSTSLFPKSADLNVLDTRQDVRIHDPDRGDSPRDPSSESDVRDLVDLLGQFLSLDPNVSRRQHWEKYLGLQLSRTWAIFDPDESKRLVAEFSMYYIQQGLTPFGSLDDQYDSDRQHARNRLMQALQANSPYVLTAIHWVSTTLGAQGKPNQMLEFNIDCWQCTEYCESMAARLYRPITRFLILHSARDAQIVARSDINEENKARLINLRKQFDAQEEIAASMRELEAQRRQETPTYLTLEVYHAWSMRDAGNYERSLKLVTKILPCIEREMGRAHLLTVSCFTIAATCYQNIPNLQNMAVSHWQDAVFHLRHCARPLLPVKYRCMINLAELQVEQGRFDEKTLPDLTEIFMFYLHTHGAESGEAWHIADRLIWPLMCRFNMEQSAHACHHYLRELHDKEWRIRNGLETETSETQNEVRKLRGLISSALSPSSPNLLVTQHQTISSPSQSSNHQRQTSSSSSSSQPHGVHQALGERRNAERVHTPVERLSDWVEVKI